MPQPFSIRLFEPQWQVETAGDCYIVSGGLLSPEQTAEGFGLTVEEDHNPAKSAERVMAFAKALLVEAEQVGLTCSHNTVHP